MSAAPTRSGRSSPMVHLRTVPTAFQARVVAARLGADGILTELRGAIGGPYPFGDVSIWVHPDDERIARELLLADEVEELFARLPGDDASDDDTGGAGGELGSGAGFGASGWPRADTELPPGRRAGPGAGHPAGSRRVAWLGWSSRQLLAAVALVILVSVALAGRFFV